MKPAKRELQSIVLPNAHEPSEYLRQGLRSMDRHLRSSRSAPDYAHLPVIKDDKDITFSAKKRKSHSSPSRSPGGPASPAHRRSSARISAAKQVGVTPAKSAAREVQTIEKTAEKKRRSRRSDESNPPKKETRGRSKRTAKASTEAENSIFGAELEMRENEPDNISILEDSISVTHEEAEQSGSFTTFNSEFVTYESYSVESAFEASGSEEQQSSIVGEISTEVVSDARIAPAELETVATEGTTDNINDDHDDESSIDESEFYDANDDWAAAEAEREALDATRGQVIELLDSDGSASGMSEEDDELQNESEHDSEHEEDNMDVHDEEEEEANSEQSVAKSSEVGSSSDGDVEIIGEIIAKSDDSAGTAEKVVDTVSLPIHIEKSPQKSAAIGSVATPAADDLEMLRKIRTAIAKFGDRFESIIAGQGSEAETSSLTTLFSASESANKMQNDLQENVALNVQQIVSDKKMNQDNHDQSETPFKDDYSATVNAEGRISYAGGHWNSRESFLPSPVQQNVMTHLNTVIDSNNGTKAPAIKTALFPEKLSSTPGVVHMPPPHVSAHGTRPALYGYGGPLAGPSPADLLYSAGKNSVRQSVEKSYLDSREYEGSASKRGFTNLTGEVDLQPRTKRISFGGRDSFAMPVTPFAPHIQSDVQHSGPSTRSPFSMPFAPTSAVRFDPGSASKERLSTLSSSPMRTMQRTQMAQSNGKLSDILVQPTMLPSSAVKRQTMSFLQRKRFEEQQQQAQNQNQQLVVRAGASIAHSAASSLVKPVTSVSSTSAAAPSAIVAKRILESLNELASPMEEQRRKPTPVAPVVLASKPASVTSVVNSTASVDNKTSFASKAANSLPRPSDHGQDKKNSHENFSVESSDKEFSFKAPVQFSTDGEATVGEGSDITFVFSPPVKKAVTGRPSVQTPKRPKSAAKEPKTPSNTATTPAPKNEKAPAEPVAKISQTPAPAPAAAPAAAGNVTIAADSVWARAVAANNDSVKCPHCLVPNPKTAATCVSCESKLPGSSGAAAPARAPAPAATTSTASSSGFTFGVPAGEVQPPAPAPVASSGFIFGSSTAASEKPIEKNDSQASKSAGFVFGTTATNSSNASVTPSTAAFTFGSTPAAPKETVAVPADVSGGFMFGSQPAAAATVASAGNVSAGFKFGVDANAGVSASSKPSDISKATLKFGADVPGPVSTTQASASIVEGPKPQAAASFSFGVPASTPATAAPVPAPAPSAVSSFMFGSSATDAEERGSSKKRAATGTDESQPAKAPTAGIFGAIAPLPVLAPSSTSASFNFGASAPTPAPVAAVAAATSTTTPAPFMFGATPAPAAAPVSAPIPAPAPAGAFMFGASAPKDAVAAAPAPAPSAAPFMFGATAPKDSATPGPTSTPASAPAASAAPFMFGAAAPKDPLASSSAPAPTPTAAPAPAPFMFGASTNATTPAATPVATSAPFMFGATTTTTTTTSLTSAPANPASAAPFMFGASTPAPAPGTANFSFGASTGGNKDTRSSTPPPQTFRFGSSSPGMVPDSPGSSMDIGYQSGDSSNLSSAAIPSAANAGKPVDLFGASTQPVGGVGIAFGQAAPFSFAGSTGNGGIANLGSSLGGAGASTPFGTGMNMPTASSFGGSLPGSLPGPSAQGAAPFMFGASSATGAPAGQFGGNAAPFGGSMTGGIGISAPASGSLGNSFAPNLAGGFSAGTSGGFSAGSSGPTTKRKILRAKIPGK